MHPPVPPRRLGPSQLTGALLALAALAALVATHPLAVDAQPCRRSCHPGEARDSHGCCVARPSSGAGEGARPTRRPEHGPGRGASACRAPQHDSAGHCCDEGADWVERLQRCVCLDNARCGSAPTQPARLLRDTAGDGVDADGDGLDCEAESMNGTYFVYCPATGDWAAANQVCRRGGYQLASIRSEDELQFVIRLLERTPNGAAANVWLGLTDQNAEHRWGWTDGAPFAYTRWFLNEPNNAGGVEHCGEFFQNQDAHYWAWNDVRCDDANGALCVGRCPAGRQFDPAAHGCR